MYFYEGWKTPQLAASSVLKVVGGKLQISNREDYGCKNSNFASQFPQNIDFQSQILYFFEKKNFWQ